MPWSADIISVKRQIGPNTLVVTVDVRDEFGELVIPGYRFIVTALDVLIYQNNSPAADRDKALNDIVAHQVHILQTQENERSTTFCFIAIPDLGTDPIVAKKATI